ncbi:MAG: hypothetical protein Q7R73_05015 [bacterium]|nr:hypothetical protein [bacterium]
MPEESKNGIHEQEIKELEQLLEEKKKALIERGEEKEHKEVFREVFHEKYQQIAGTPIAPSAGAGITPVPPVKTSPVSKEKETELQSFIEMAFADGLVSTINRAKASSPWLLDELHDRLSDEYYEKLIQARQLEKI